FFQAEDGIRDSSVTGVQTCALPIYEGDRQARIEQQVRMEQPAPPVDEQHGDHAQEDQRLPEELLAARQALRVALGELEPVVGEQIGRASCRERVGSEEDAVDRVRNV